MEASFSRWLVIMLLTQFYRGPAGVGLGLVYSGSKTPKPQNITSRNTFGRRIAYRRLKGQVGGLQLNPAKLNSKWTLAFLLCSADTKGMSMSLCCSSHQTGYLWRVHTGFWMLRSSCSCRLKCWRSRLPLSQLVATY